MGPVKNLEIHVPKDWWKTYFSETYYKTDGDVVQNDVNTRREVDQLLKILKLKKTSRIGDFCCGQARHILEFARRGYHNIIGVDASPFLLDLGRKQARQLNLNIPLIQGDVVKIQLPEKMDTIYILGNAFGYFQSANQNIKLLKNIRNNLASGGKVILDIMDGEKIKKNLVPFSAEWVDKNHIVCRERQIGKGERRIISRRIFIDTRKGVLSDDFYAIDLFSPKQISALLKRAGFKNVSMHAVTPSRSKSKQSTGLMGHRLFIVGVKP